MPSGKPTKKKKCSICGEEFLPKCPAQRICEKDHYSPCPICGKPVLWNSTSKDVTPCSKECRDERRRRRNREKYGVDHPMQLKSVREKHNRTMMERYGVEYPMQSEEIKKKAVETNLEKFGTTWALGNKEFHDRCQDTMEERYGARTTMQSDVLRKKVRETCIEKYGEDNALKNRDVRNKSKKTFFERYVFENPNQCQDIIDRRINTRLNNHEGHYWTPEMRDKYKQTCLERYGDDNPSKSEIVQQHIRETTMQRYGVPYGCMLPSANKNRISEKNKKFLELMISRRIEVSEDDFEFRVGRKFFNIAIPDTNILIELDPTYTHNTEWNHYNNCGIKPDYHVNKTELAESNGYRCIHIFDWDNWDDVIWLLKPCDTTIYARNCKIFKINQKVCNQFLKENHLQGSNRGNLLCLGLVCDDELVQVMTFGQPRYNKNYNAELLRLCSKRGTRVVGGASKLFKFATIDYGIDNIISYCDRAKFTGDVYEKIGMTLCNITPQNCIWSKGEKKITANLLRQRGYDQLFGTNYGKGTDNEQLMLDHGWLPIYDCGQKVFEYRSKNTR